MVRKSTRKNAGQLPERYRDDESSSSSSPLLDDREYNLPSQNVPSSMLLQPSLQPRPVGRPRGRPPNRDRLQHAKEVVPQLRYDREPAMYPQAAFPTKEFPLPLPIRGKKKVNDGSEKRDSIDVNMSAKQPLQEQPSRLYNADVDRYLLDSRYVDDKGNTMHGLARHYDKHVEEYEANKKDNQGDAKDKTAAFRWFLESPEAQQIRHHEGRGALMMAFEKWWMQGGDKLATAGTVSPQDSEQARRRNIKDFRDEKFATLHFKLQWCMIQEIEEDLARFPPMNVTPDAGPRSYHFARNVLGINSSLVVRAIQQKMDEAMDKEECMPRKKHYTKATAYLRERGLPVTLIEMYDYLDG